MSVEVECMVRINSLTVGIEPVAHVVCHAVKFIAFVHSMTVGIDAVTHVS